jgi:hypothetical protein
VSALCTYGVKHDEIANYLGIDPKTLRKHYRQELDESKMRSHKVVGDFLYQAASGAAMEDGATHAECLRAAMFWAKTQMGWRETDNHNHMSEDGSMSPPTKIEIVAAEGNG